jgi:uncharacterized protein YPO0396
LEEIGFKMHVDTPESFILAQEQLRRKAEEYKKDNTEVQMKRDALLLPRDKANEKLAEDKDELHALMQRRTNLPESNAAMRRQICKGLDLDEKVLPFVAELIAVRNEEYAWEASIEKLLRNFALTLLVPNNLYARVSDFVEKNRMHDQKGHGERLNYQQAGITAQVTPLAEKSDGVYVKLNIKDHSLTPWLKHELKRRFDYLCCEDMDSFRAISEHAMTKNRHIKHRIGQHEKDDRLQTTDRSKFVLGWDNKEKRQFLKECIEETQRTILQYDETIHDCEATLARLRYQSQITETLLEKQHFSEIDERSHEETLIDLRRQWQQLVSGSKEMQVLEEQRHKIETIIEQQEKEKNETTERKGRLASEISQTCIIIENKQPIIERARLDGTFFVHETFFDDWKSMLEGHPRSKMPDIQNACHIIKNDLKDRINRLLNELDPVEKKVISKMYDYLRAFQEDKTDLLPEVSSLSGFEHILSRIVEDDLPRHEERFQEYLDDKVTQELIMLRSGLYDEERKIHKKIDLLNTSLQRIPYRPGTYMRLEVRKIQNDAQINDFRNRMDDCIAHSLENNFTVGEERYKKLEKLITDLEKEPNWTERVVDVRRWVTFRAKELDKETDETKNVWEDSSGQSGGEKAKLAFTILVASIAYQYDIDSNRKPSDRFHFVMVDEMFSKIDDQFSEYALKLFEQFRLQLLIVAPLDPKARVTEPFVKKYLHVVKDEKTNCSRVYTMTAAEFEKNVEENRVN